MQHEFHLSVTPVGDSRYLIRTERVAPGVPLSEELAVWPVEDWLTQAQALMGDPLLGLLRGRAPASLGALGAAEGGGSSLTGLGHELYQALFSGSVRDSWLAALGIAQHQYAGAPEDLLPRLRLRLGLKGPGLPRLPWEALHDGNRALTMVTDLTFTRYQGTFSSIARPARHPPQPLRVLMVVATPNDLADLSTEQEAEHLRLELSSQIEITLLCQPGRADLTRALEHGNYQVLHYAGHSDLGSDGGNLCLVSSQTGLTEFLSGDDLAGLLANNGVRLAVFNSCRGSHTPASQERTLAEALVKRGIPAVLAMAERIPDDVALTLSRLFYRNLTQGASVDLSLARARQGLLSSYSSSQPYWVLPVLYMHPEFDGYLLPSPIGTMATVAIPLPWPTAERPEIPAPALAASEATKTAPPLLPESLPGGHQKTSPSSGPHREAEVQPTHSSGSARSSRWRLPGLGAEAPALSGISAAVLAPRNRFSLTLAIAGAAVAAGLGLATWGTSQGNGPSAKQLMPEIPVNVAPVAPEPEAGEPPSITDSATTSDSTATYSGAIAQLLDQGKLAEAEAALNQIPANPQTAKVPAEANYLWGRLAMQAYQQRFSDYRNTGLRVARQNFQQAVEQQPGQATYLNALGFAHYSNGELMLANDAWLKALAMAEQDNSAQGRQAATLARAGVALTLMRSARDETSDTAVEAKLAQAIEQRDQVLAADKTYATPDSLPDIWLWTAPIMADWKALLKVQLL
ncbi:CHAT domain-containing protein [Leptolyngbya sp. FACHB-261]|nr:CHAT domain-containing protein [Leptolyngbya sp. FACHB-261]